MCNRLNILIMENYNFDSTNSTNILVSFKGVITPETITSLLDLLESKMDIIQEESLLKKKVYRVVVELLQNLYHHHIDDPSLGAIRTCLFMIGKENNHYNVITGNYIKNARIADLKKRIEQINLLLPEGIKEYYREELKNSISREEVGLGLSSIIRRTNKSLIVDFVPLTVDFSFFSLFTIIE